jgi:hypothetical protein
LSSCTGRAIDHDDGLVTGIGPGTKTVVNEYIAIAVTTTPKSDTFVLTTPVARLAEQAAAEGLAAATVLLVRSRDDGEMK